MIVTRGVDIPLQSHSGRPIFQQTRVGGVLWSLGEFIIHVLLQFLSVALTGIMTRFTTPPDRSESRLVRGGETQRLTDPPGPVHYPSLPELLKHV